MFPRKPRIGLAGLDGRNAAWLGDNIRLSKAPKQLECRFGRDKSVLGGAIHGADYFLKRSSKAWRASLVRGAGEAAAVCAGWA